MTKEYDSYCKSKNEDMIRRNWFPDHIIEQDENWGEWVLWRKPDTGIYMVRYHIYRNRLIVTGDIGSAVYVWSENVSWNFLANCSIDYFAGKCIASEYGLWGKTWNSECAEQRVREAVEDRDKNTYDEEAYEEAIRACGYEYGWLIFLGSSEGEELFGCDSEYADIGMTYGIRIEGHLVGLKMMKEIRDKN